MNTTTTANWSHDTRPRTATLVAGIALLAMAVIAAFSNFGVINNLAVPGDPGATAANLVNWRSVFVSRLSAWSSSRTRRRGGGVGALHSTSECPPKPLNARRVVAHCVRGNLLDGDQQPV